METKAGERILDKARQGQDLEELNQELAADAHEGKLTPRDIEQFKAVADAMHTILSEAQTARIGEHLTPATNAVLDLALIENVKSRLPPRYQLALEQLYTAATARHADRGTFVSGIERGILLNQALMHLQPILSLGLRPDFREGRASYTSLVSEVNQVRRDIAAAKAVQLVPPKRRKAPAEAVQDDDDKPDNDSDNKPDNEPHDELNGELNGGPDVTDDAAAQGDAAADADTGGSAQ